MELFCIVALITISFQAFRHVSLQRKIKKLESRLNKVECELTWPGSQKDFKKEPMEVEIRCIGIGGGPKNEM